MGSPRPGVKFPGTCIEVNGNRVGFKVHRDDVNYFAPGNKYELEPKKGTKFSATCVKASDQQLFFTAKPEKLLQFTVGDKYVIDAAPLSPAGGDSGSTGSGAQG